MKVAQSKPEEIRINHIDKDIITLGTFIPIKNNGDTETKPVIIINNNNRLWFEIVDKDYIIDVHGKAYQPNGYPIEMDTMLSLEGFFALFGNDARDFMPLPTDKVLLNLNISPKKLLDDIQAFLREYVGFYTMEMKKDNNMYDLISHWILYTHIYDVWNTCSYLKLMGDFSSGKTIMAQAIRLLGFSASSAEARISDAALYRGLHTVGGVKLLDEITMTRNDMVSFRDLLKSGIQRDASHEVVNTGDYNKIDRFRTYCPKVVSGTDCENIDPVLSSRMIEVVMQKAPPKDPVARNDVYSDETKESARQLRDRLYMFRLFYGREAWLRKKRVDKTKYFKDSDLSNRFYDIYAPLFTISGLYSGHGISKKLERAANDQMEMRRVEIYNQLDVPILQILYQQLHPLKDDGCVWLSDKDISNQIIDLESSSRRLFDRKTLTDRYSPESIGARIRGMGITKEHREKEIGLQWKYIKKTIFKVIYQKGLDFTWITLSQGQQIDAVIKTMEELEKSYPLGIYAPTISEKVGFNCQTLLKVMEGKNKVKFENGKWLLIK